MPQRPRTIDLQEELFLSLIDACSTIRKWAGSLTEQKDMNLSDYHLLRIVQNEERTTATILRQKLRMTAPSVTQLVLKHEERGWIRRVQDTDDKRVQCITLTPQGTKAVSQMRKTIAKATASLQLPNSTAETIIENLHTISFALSSTPLS